jgi:cobalt-zinc-cadmium efflux system outer membrane protein
VLVAQETVRATRALARFTDEHYLIQVENLKGTQVAAYEPKLFRSLAMQARGSYVQAVNGYYAAWKQLAANMGVPGMHPTEVAGSADMPIPMFRFDAILEHALVHHTDVLTAQNSVQKNRYSLRLAQVTPIPDVDVRLMVQKDFTGTPFFVTPSVQVSVPFPVWDQNQGNIIQAQSTLMQSGEDVHQTRDELTRRLSEAYGRYESNRVLLEYYRDYILPDLVQVFRGIYARWDRDPLAGLNFIDISTAQQNLATGITTYLATLGTLWTAVVDVADVLQTDDLFKLADGQCPAPVPDLGQLLELPCSHPCSPLQDPALKGADPSWPSAPPPPHPPAPPEMPKPSEEKAPPRRKEEQ